MGVCMIFRTECIGQEWKDGCRKGVRRCIQDMGMKGN